MNQWKTISTQDDLEALYEEYFGFHDSCIVAVNYQSGAGVDRKGTLYCPGAGGHRMSVIFQSQMAKRSLELYFIGVRQVHLIGWEYNYSCNICEAYLSFVEGLLPGELGKQIVWSNYSAFDPHKIDNAVHEPADTYIIANELRWRYVE